MNHIKYLFLIFISITILSCKKDKSLAERKVVPTDGLSSSQAKPTAKFETDKSTFYKNDTITFKNTSSYPTAQIKFSWCKVADKVFTEFATTKEISPIVYPTPTKDIIALITANQFGVDTMIMELIINDVPKSATITLMRIDSINLVNPITNSAWNTNGGPNCFFKFYDVNNVWIDSTIRSQNNGKYGWSSNNPLSPNQIGFLTLSDAVAPIGWKYPNTSLYILFSKMLSETTLKIYNRNPNLNIDLIASFPFHFIDFFRKPQYYLPPNSQGLVNYDIAMVPLRSADGKTVITIKINFLT
jgi:hypothetical protein